MLQQPSPKPPTNKDRALKFFSSNETVAYALIVAHFQEERLLITNLNARALKLLRAPEDPKERASYKQYLQDSHLSGLFESKLYLNLKSQSESVEVRMGVDCYSGKQLALVEFFPKEWGAVLRLTPIKSFNFKQLTQLTDNVTDLLNSAAGLISSSKKVAIALASIITGLIGASFATPWIPVLIPGVVEAAKPQTETVVKRLLESQAPSYSNLRYNAIAVFLYTRAGTKREFLAGSFRTLNEQVLKDAGIRDTFEDGHYQAYLAHATQTKEYPQGKPFTLLRSEYEAKSPNHSISVMMREGGVEQLTSYPIYSGGELRGYVSIGFVSPLDEDVQDQVEDRLRVTATLVGEVLG